MPLLILLFLLLGVEVYAYQAVVTVAGESGLVWLYWLFTALLLLAIFAAFRIGRHRWPKAVRVYLPPIFLSSFFGKMIASLVMIGGYLVGIIGSAITGNAYERTTGLAWGAIAAGGIPFLLLMYGMIRNAYNYQFREIDLQLNNLPKGLRGLKIVQLSDIHAGSLTRPAAIEAAIEKINSLQPDLIFFTGDLVNNVATEIEPFIPIFSRLKAQYGVFSITGNHDYGDYVAWENPQQKRANFQHLMDQHGKLGWRLLMNEHEVLEIKGSKLAVLGIENWSAFGRFPKYGKMAEAYRNTGKADVKLLLSHDPTHWKAEVLKEYQDVDVMFAGHTHGFQFGFEWGALKWSPGQYFIKEWAGLYKQGNQQLYVNRGFGFTFYPGRVGLLPEVSIFTLR